MDDLPFSSSKIRSPLFAFYVPSEEHPFREEQPPKVFRKASKVLTLAETQPITLLLKDVAGETKPHSTAWSPCFIPSCGDLLGATSDTSVEVTRCSPLH
jgi:hypothetical protein